MTTFIALLRGINVGGANKLPMKALVSVCESLGLEDVATYIQSGNVVFRAAGVGSEIAPRLTAAIEASHGFAPRVMVLSKSDFLEAAVRNPYPEAAEDPKSLHVTFLENPPSAPDLVLLESLRHESERFELDAAAFYLHAPNGIGRSRLAARIERALGVSGTARNWRTVSKLAAMAEVLDS